MELQHVNVKIFVDGALAVDEERFIQIFHRWIAEQSLDELLIDVADYRHVPAGPGVVLVGHEADYALDHAGGRSGLLYNRKHPLAGANQERIAQAFQAAAAACRRLEEELADEGPLRFSRHRFAVLVNDRGLAPNTPETLAACRPEIEAFLKESLGSHEYAIDAETDPRKRFGMTIRCAEPFDL